MRYLILFTSLSTLICCALPALFVMLGFGATVAMLVSSFPVIVVLSQHKIAVFAFSAFFILVGWIQSFRPAACPIGEAQEACSYLKKGSRWILLISTMLWIAGFTVAFAVPFFMGF